MLFEIDNPFEASVFTDFISQHPQNKEEQTIQLHFRYYYEKRNDRKILRWSVWGGNNEGQNVPDIYKDTWCKKLKLKHN